MVVSWMSDLGVDSKVLVSERMINNTAPNKAQLDQDLKPLYNYLYCLVSLHTIYNFPPYSFLGLRW